MLSNIIKSAFHKIGLEVRRKQKPHQPEGEESSDFYKEILATVRNRSMVAPEGLFTLHHQCLFCEKNGIEGDFVECGVWKGGSVGVMAMSNLKFGKKQRHLHLFDSFQEICEPDETVDGVRAIREVKEWTKDGGTKGRLVALEGVYDLMGGPGSVEGNRKLLVNQIGYDPDFLHFHKGWFQDTLPADHQLIERIAILRLDADWYASTKICLEYLYPKVVSGGFIIIDDYGAYDGCRKAVDEYLAAQGIRPYLNYVNNDIRYIIKE